MHAGHDDANKGEEKEDAILPIKVPPPCYQSIPRHSGVSPATNSIQNQEEVPDYLCLSLFTTFCCCLVFGIIAIVTANEANTLRERDPQKAKEQANMSKIFNTLGIICGVLATTVIAIVFAIQ